MHEHDQSADAPTTMQAVRLVTPGIAGLVVEELETPRVAAAEALVRVHAAAITRDELDWPTDRLPATPSYELSGVVVAVGSDVDDFTSGDEVYGLTPFDRDGVAAEYAAVPASLLASKPGSLDHVEAAAIPLPALSAWQGLFEQGRLEEGQRVLIHGAGGGVGLYATQLARWRGAHVIGTTSPATLESARRFGAHELLDQSARLDDLEPLDLVFDTVGGEALAGAASIVRPTGRIVSVAAEPPKTASAGVEAIYFVVRPDREQLAELTRLVDAAELRTAIDSVFALRDAQAAFERSMSRGKSGKVVLRVVDG
jgi:NADPH:quinone reductase-like Zn-dependent oxidoreductase